jgi:hypothetical protein
MRTNYRQNLIKLAKYLWNLNPKYFDMSTYYNRPKMKSYLSRYISTVTLIDHRCGTVGCAVGHAPLAGVGHKENECWQDYAHRVFIGKGKYSSIVFSYLFDAEWYEVDNSPRNTAKRIVHFILNERKVLKDIIEQNGDPTIPEDNGLLRVPYHTMMTATNWYKGVTKKMLDELVVEIKN